MAAADTDSDLLKKWTIKKLEDISDADSDVLADYVLALVKSDDPEPVAKANCIESLGDFLGDNAKGFVDEVFNAIANKSYDPKRATKPKPPAPRHALPVREDFDQGRPQRESRKRGYRDWDKAPTFGDANEAGDRPSKQVRRGKSRASEPWGRQQVQRHGPPSFPAQAALPPGFPQFDPNDPWAAFQAMNQMLGMMAGFDGAFGRQRCNDYDTHGFCMAGAACPFEHGDNPLVVPNGNAEYDPENASLLNFPAKPSRHASALENGRGAHKKRGRGGTARGRGGTTRSSFSQIGNRDRSNCSLVVEHIPEQSCSEDGVRDFFGQFGDIDEVTMQPDQRLAIVKYASHDAAQSAYESPKAVFDNRFVKVYWFRPERPPRPVNGSSAHRSPETQTADTEMHEPDEDPAELAQRQQDAQRKFEEAKRQREETEQQKRDLDAKLSAMDDERRTIEAALAKRAGESATDHTHPNGSEDSAKTKALKEQLARLEAEAKSLGIDPDAPTAYGTAPPYNPRGAYRGRGRGRGTWRGRGGAVMRLDNRPKTIAIVFSDDGASYASHEEKMGQFLLFTSVAHAGVAPHPDRQDAALLRFEQRYEGENFMQVARDGQDLPYIGNVQLSWYNPALADGSNGLAKSQMALAESGDGGKSETTVRRDAEADGGPDEQDLDHY